MLGVGVLSKALLLLTGTILRFFLTLTKVVSNTVSISARVSGTDRVIKGTRAARSFLSGLSSLGSDPWSRGVSRSSESEVSEPGLISVNETFIEQTFEVV